jgi:release factor glutamine methyltransferase
LREAGLSQPEADIAARLLAEHVLGWDTARILTDGHDPEPNKFADRYETLVARRAAREPLAYIVGRQDFWDLAFEVSPAVLIPRPETELIVEAALAVWAPSRAAAVVDACTGCGCIAVALACERPGATIVATDISEAALAVAGRNARRHGTQSRVRFVQADLLEPLAGPFDLIVANPPYVQTRDRAGLQPEVRDHEPDVAIFGGADGIRIVARLVEQAATRLNPGGHLIFEFGFGQEILVEQLISQKPGLTMLDLRRDLQGIARTAVARRD